VTSAVLSRVPVSESAIEDSRQRLLSIPVELDKTIVERSGVTLDLTTAWVAGEHCALLGPPGTAKSKLVRTIMKVFNALTTNPDGSFSGVLNYFEYLLTPFTEPNELFGPIDIVAYKSGNYRRMTTRMLPEAHIAFLDEALALDTPIPTPTGWTTIGDIKVGDMVMGTGSPTRVTGLTPVKTGTCFRVTFRDGESVVADAGHLWLARPSEGTQPFKVWTTQQMVDDGRAFVIPLSEAVDLPEVDIPFDPYTFGLWLGNGNCWNGEIIVRNEMADTVLREIQKTQPEARLVAPRKGQSPAITYVSMASTGFRGRLGLLGMLNNKHLPTSFLRGSIQQRLRLLQGLMDTDGHMMQEGTCVFSNTNESIVRGVCDIVRSLGITCTLRPVRDLREGARGPHQQCWKVTFHASVDYPPFLHRPHAEIVPSKHRPQRRISAIEKVDDVPVRCIEVEADDHLFLAGTGWAVTHNCFKANSAILNALLTMLNERIFHEGGFVKETPLRMVVMASNELPSQGLSALWDRCLVRHAIEPISRPENEAALFAGTLPVAVGQPLASLADADAVAGLASVVTLPAEVLAAMSKLHSDLKAKGISVTDRRKDQEGRWLQVCAALDGKTEVAVEHLARLAPLLWSRDEDRPIVDLAIEPYAAAWRVQLKLVQAAMKKLDAEVPVDLSKSTLQQLGGWAKEVASLNKSLLGYKGKPGVDATLQDLANRGGAIKQRLVELRG